MARKRRAKRRAAVARRSGSSTKVRKLEQSNKSLRSRSARNAKDAKKKLLLGAAFGGAAAVGGFVYGERLANEGREIYGIDARWAGAPLLVGGASFLLKSRNVMWVIPVSLGVGLLGSLAMDAMDPLDAGFGEMGEGYGEMGNNFGALPAPGDAGFGELGADPNPADVQYATDGQGCADLEGPEERSRKAE